MSDFEIIEDFTLEHTIPIDMQIEGIIEPLDVADELEEMFLNGLPKGESTGYFYLDQLYTVQKSQWTIVTGIPGSGKSTFLDNILVNLADKSGWKHLVCSPEHQPIKRHIASIASIYINKPFHQNTMTMDEYTHALAFVQDHFKFIYPSEINFTGNYILALADEVLQSGFEFDGFVIDPYNELEHKRPAGMTETEYVSMLLSRFRRYARDRQKHLWLVAHPTKLQKIQMKHSAGESTDELTKSIYPVPTLYDISGSAHFFNKADMGLSVWRDKSDTENRVQVHCQKVRFRECGKLGVTELRFDWQTGKYSE